MSNLIATDTEPLSLAQLREAELKAQRHGLQNFLRRLNSDPNPAEVQENKHAGNTKYLPISYLEMTLDEYFFGLWETVNFRWERQGNELVGCLDLRVFHPTAQIWITRTGTSATMIRLKANSQSYELENKIINALEMDFPHLKADCLRNAVQSLGKLFGRDLNRKFQDEYKPLLHQQAIEAGERTVAVVNRDDMARARSSVEQALEMARMDDKTEKSFRLSLATCETAQDCYDLLGKIGDYMPEPADPRLQNKARAANPGYKQ